MPQAKFKFSGSGGAVKIPRAAARFDGTVKFEGPIPDFNPGPAAGENPTGPVPGSEGGDNPNPKEPVGGGEGGPVTMAARKKFTEPIGVKIMARSGEPIDHPWWGPIVHDLSGINNKEANGGKVLVDYAHKGNEDPKHILGFGDLNGIDLSDGNLNFPAKLMPRHDRPDDMATDVLCKMSAGVPMQSSIDWGGDGVKLEHFDEDEMCQVNGKEFKGPLTCVRSWPLASVALCAVGSDQKTGASAEQFADAADSLTITIVSHKQSSAAAGSPGTSAAAAAGDDPVAANPFTAKQYIDAFGDKGARWFCEGFSFADATVKFNAEQAEANKKANEAKDAQIAALTRERDEAAGKLAIAPKGNGAAGFRGAEAGGEGGAGGGRDRNFAKRPDVGVFLEKVDTSQRKYFSDNVAYGGQDTKDEPSQPAFRHQMAADSAVVQKILIPAFEAQLAKLNGRAA